MEKKISTGYNNIDLILDGGWEQGKFYLVLYEPELASTALCKGMVDRLANKEKVPTILFNLESVNQQWVAKQISRILGTDSISSEFGPAWVTPPFPITKNSSDNGLLSMVNVQNVTIPDIRKKVAEYVHKKGIKVVIIDYMQLPLHSIFMMGLINKGFREMATELNVAVVLFTHSNIQKQEFEAIKNIKQWKWEEETWDQPNTILTLTRDKRHHTRNYILEIDWSWDLETGAEARFAFNAERTELEEIEYGQEDSATTKMKEFKQRILACCNTLSKGEANKDDLKKAQELIDTRGPYRPLLYFKEAFADLLYLVGMQKRDKAMLERAEKEGSYKAHVALNTYFKSADQLHERIDTYNEFKHSQL